jgi:anti-sigma-K factor RskA
MSAPEPETPLDLAPAYALGALDPAEARAFERVLATSPEAREAVAEFREVAALLALADDDVAPAPDLRGRLLSRLAERPAAPPLARLGPMAWAAIAAGLAVLVGLGAATASLRRQVAERDAAIAQRDSALALRTEALAARERQLEHRQAVLDAILRPGVQMVQLTASGDPDPGMQLFWDRQRRRAVLYGYRLKPVPQGRAYQLWFIEGGRPMPSITFTPERDGRALVADIEVPDRGPLSAAAITVEPASGSPTPTSQIVLIGTVQQGP